ncbi:unnamed protein product [Medioppia subpectinata]|uniref:Uncharacterized protein n=1 Tax=Medioppia subpectinata TaxID=1979941 RepID=A0A7R9KS09_9ACAR|nr:unnamed protein product [Medioppia subpectinata]CAG2107390.1 unnamed protein product [Medioppia subpectinata]
MAFIATKRYIVGDGEHWSKPQLTIVGYIVGDGEHWSKPYEFVSVPNDHQWTPSIALVGDMGVDNGRAIPSLIKNSQNGKFDAVIHIGIYFL